MFCAIIQPKPGIASGKVCEQWWIGYRKPGQAVAGRNFPGMEPWSASPTLHSSIAEPPLLAWTGAKPWLPPQVRIRAEGFGE